MNPAKASGKLQLNLDMAAVSHIHHVYTQGLTMMILSDDECRRSGRLVEIMERALIESEYMTEAEVKSVRVAPKRFLTMDDAKLPS